MKIIAWDLETIRDTSKISILQEPKPDKRMTDPVKIEKDIAKKMEEAIEIMGLNPATAMICCFGWFDGSKAGSIMLEEESPEAEKALLKKAWDVLKDANQVVTFNGFNFDVPVLLMRSILCRVKPTLTINRKRYTTLNHYDARMVLGNWDTYAKGDLNFYSNLLLGKSAKDEMSGDMVQEYWSMGLKDDIATYCESDCKTTFEIFDLISKYYL